MLQSELLQVCRDILGATGVLTGNDVSARSAAWGQGPCQAAAILRPRNTDQLSRLLGLCYRNGQPVVPQGGRTGRAGGCLAGPAEFAISLELMREIEEVDPITRTLSAQAGVTLERAQDAATAQGLYLPLDFGARGSATIGGVLATNAGGHLVLRYGMARQLVSGLEAVLPDGRVLSRMDTMLKNNAGYDLKQLFIGSEGTLGIITRAVMRLSTRPLSCCTALIGVSRLDDALAVLRRSQQTLGSEVSACEIMWQSYFDLARGSSPSPLADHHPLYLLLETAGSDPQGDAETFASLLEELMEQGHIDDAAIAQSDRERQQFWRIRENTAAYLAWAPVFNFDISLPLKTMEHYLEALRRQLRQRWPELRMAVFGHLGDGNLHLAISTGQREDADDVNHLVYGDLKGLGGSISAEHGIGTSKRDYLHYSRSAEEIGLMRTLKRALDPRGLLNPGKVLPLDDPPDASV